MFSLVSSIFLQLDSVAKLPLACGRAGSAYAGPTNGYRLSVGSCYRVARDRRWRRRQPIK
jgi:hypothetical protein